MVANKEGTKTRACTCAVQQKEITLSMVADYSSNITITINVDKTNRIVKISITEHNI